MKVVDRRRFDESGELRPDRPLPEEKPAAPPPEQPRESVRAGNPAPAQAPRSEATRPPDPAAGSTTGKETSPLFVELIAGLAQQAEMLMNGAQGLPAAPAEAQRVIEYLSMLENKTQGNLSAEENELLSNVVFQLRTLFVQNAK